jgi:hypothetical protein
MVLEHEGGYVNHPMILVEKLSMVFQNVPILRLILLHLLKKMRKKFTTVITFLESRVMTYLLLWPVLFWIMVLILV